MYRGGLEKNDERGICAALLIWICIVSTMPAATIVAWGNEIDGMPLPPGGLSGIQQICSGLDYSAALDSDGHVTIWGYRYVRKEVQANQPDNTFIKIAGGIFHMLGITENGTVQAWGWSEGGQCDVPVNLEEVIDIAAGYQHSLALKSDGTVVAWGNNQYGQCTVPGDLAGIVAIAAGSNHSLALNEDGSVTGWGNNEVGQASPPRGLSGATAITAGYGHSLALKQDGTVVAWGNNQQGQCDVPPDLTDVVAIAAGNSHSMVLKADGTVVAWGKLGSQEASPPEGLQDVVEISAGPWHCLALRADGSLVQWSEYDADKVRMPTSLDDVVDVELGTSAIAIREDGSLVAWGSNEYGQCDIPKDLPPIRKVVKGGDGPGIYVLALDFEGHVHIWGTYPNGLGPSFVPEGLSNVVDVTAGYSWSSALKEDGTVVAWGQPMAPGITDVPAILTDPATSHVAAIASCDIATAALRAPGSDPQVVVWGWNGHNGAYGTLDLPPGLNNVKKLYAGGLGFTALKNDGTVTGWGVQFIEPPVGLSNVVDLSGGGDHVLALKADGTVIAWGDNNSGQADVPEGLQDVVQISAGDAHSLALRADGTVVAWGYNFQGQCDVPEGLTNVTAIYAEGDYSIALVENNTYGPYPVLSSGYSDTTPWLGWLYVNQAPWIWCVDMAKWLYCPADYITESGAWVYVPK